MKNIILVSILTMPVFANYIPMDMVGTDSQVTVFLKSNDCVSHYKKECIKIPFGYSKEFHALTDIMQNDLDSPIWATRSLIEACIDEQDCKDKQALKECIDGRHAIYNAEFTEVWCNKIIGYNQIPTGEKKVVIDEAKKAAYDAKELKINDRLERQKRGQVNRDKCKAALDYIAGSNTDSGADEATIDAMMVAFKDVYDALQANRPGKAARLIELITEPSMQTLKAELLEILE